MTAQIPEVLLLDGEKLALCSNPLYTYFRQMKLEPDSPHGEDESDPRGGVRWVVPGKAEYWSDHKR